MPSFPVHHQLLELTHVHRVGDAIQPSHPLSSTSLTFNLSQYQGLFQWVSSMNQVAKVLGFQLQHQSFQWIVRTYFLYNWLICQSFTIDSLAYEITQPIKTNHTAFPHHSCPLWWPTHCGVCFTLYLPKSIPYLSLCFSLNYFCGETSRTQASLGPETRYCGFRLGLSPAMWIWVPNWLLAGFQSQSEVNSFKSIID